MDDAEIAGRDVPPFSICSNPHILIEPAIQALQASQVASPFTNLSEASTVDYLVRRDTELAIIKQEGSKALFQRDVELAIINKEGINGLLRFRRATTPNVMCIAAEPCAESPRPSVESQLVLLGDMPFAGKYSLSHIVWALAEQKKINPHDTMVATFQALHRMYNTDSSLRAKLRSLTVIPYQRKTIPSNVSILYAKAGRVPQPVIELLANRLQHMVPEISGIINPLTDDKQPSDAIMIGSKRVRQRQAIPDPFDASTSVPQRKGVPPPPPANLVPMIIARPVSEETWAAADVLGMVGVGAGFVSVFLVLQRMVKIDQRRQSLHIDLLQDIQRNPFSFQTAVSERCRQYSRLTGRVEWLPELRPHHLSASVSIRENETMEVWRWPATSASQQGKYTLCHKVYDAVVHFNPNVSWSQILDRPPSMR